MCYVFPHKHFRQGQLTHSGQNLSQVAKLVKTNKLKMSKMFQLIKMWLFFYIVQYRKCISLISARMLSSAIRPMLQDSGKMYGGSILKSLTTQWRHKLPWKEPGGLRKRTFRIRTRYGEIDLKIQNQSKLTSVSELFLWSHCIRNRNCSPTTLATLRARTSGESLWKRLTFSSFCFLNNILLFGQYIVAQRFCLRAWFVVESKC